MKKSSTLVLFLSLSILMSSCYIGLNDFKDWTCVCIDVNTNIETSRFIIPDEKDKKAVKECNKSDLLTLGVITVDCELEE